jgi:hypothetical protein
MRALKTVVIALGVVLVAAFGLLIFGLSQNWHRLADAPRPSADASQAPSARAGEVRSWGKANLPLDPQTQVENMVAAGNLVVLQVTVTEGQQQLLVVDPAHGTLIGTFAFGGP